MLSSPGCWAAYGEVLARGFSDYRLTRLHRLTVDAYPAQHPGVNVPAARRSVGLHLSRLYLLLECGWSMERANNATLAITEFKDRCDWLEPLTMIGTLSVREVLQVASNQEHENRVRAWAASVRKAWAVHHDTSAEVVCRFVKRDLLSQANESVNVVAVFRQDHVIMPLFTKR
jgi:Family of unknown function (DUF5946)